MAKKADTRRADPAKPVIAAALQLAVERGWANLALADIAAAAKVPLAIWLYSTAANAAQSPGDLLLF